MDKWWFCIKSGCNCLIQDDKTSWELEPLNALTQSGQIYAFRHNGFWQPMDTLREKNILNELWNKEMLLGKFGDLYFENYRPNLLKKI